MIIQERETEGDSSTAKYSVLPVCFFLFLSPPPLCPQPLPALHTGTLTIPDVVIRYWRLGFSKERGVKDGGNVNGRGWTSEKSLYTSSSGVQ